MLLGKYTKLIFLVLNFTPHAQRERGKVIVVCVYINMFVDRKIFESYFNDRLTFSSIHGRTSRRIYRLALPLLSSQTLPSLRKLRIFLFNAYLSLFVRRMT